MESELQVDHRRRKLVMLAASLAGAGCMGRELSGRAHAASKSVESVSVTSFKDGSGSDWTRAVVQASSTSRRVYFPAGEYIVREANWPANTEIYGDGEATILRVPGDANYLFTNDSGSSRPEENISDLYMHDLQLRGSCDQDGFSEYKHLVSLNGVSHVLFRNVLFRGFRGDGIYLGSGNTAGTERHNLDVRIENCRFDGINNANRNAITVIDGDGIVIENSIFENTTTPNMPGAIDFEPNRFSFPRIRNIRVANNTFTRVGGSTGIIAFSIPSTVAALATTITVEKNTSTDGLGRNPFFFFNANRYSMPDGPDNDIAVRGNTVRGGGGSFLVAGKRIVLQDNVFEDLSLAGCIGYTKSADAARDVDLVRNKFLRCGTIEGAALGVFNAANLRFVENEFVDCGSGVAPRAAAVILRRGQSANISFEGNVFSSPAGKTLSAIAMDPGHLLTPPSRFLGNSVNGLSVRFPTRS